MSKLLNKNTIVLADQAVFSGGSFLITVLLARTFEPSEFGLYSSITLFNYAVVSLLNALIIQPLQVSLGKVENQKTYVSFNFWMQLILVSLISFGLSVLMGFKIELLKDFSQLGVGVLIYFTGFVLHDYFRKLFLAKADTQNAFIIDFITTFSHISVLIFVYFNHTISFEVTMYYIGLCYIPACVYSVFRIKPTFNELSSWKSYGLMHIQQGSWLLLTTLTQWWSSNLFIVTTGFYFGKTALGAFRLVQTLFGLLNLVLQTFENYVLPEASRKLAISPSDAKKYLFGITKKSGFIFGVILSVLFVFAKQIITLVGGAKYADFAYIVQGMSILYVFIFIAYPIRLSIRMLVLNSRFFAGYVLSLIFSLLTFRYLLKEFNVTGAIIGLIASQIITMIYWQFILIKNKFVLWK
jgi:O-antigen/teichoic acid export membrane protein